MSDNPKAIMFFHPGPEYKTRGDVKLCETSHTRNFMVVDGDLIGKNGKEKKNTCLGFWGEWSSHADIEKVGKKKFFKPFYVKNCGCGQNDNIKGCKGKSSRCSSDRCDTDPFVFGKRFCYVNCQQESSKTLCDLPAGSIILFGSRKNEKFVLDTVFVVEASIDKWLKNKDKVKSKLKKDYDLYNSASLGVLRAQSSEECRRFYFGTTYRNYNIPFSFVPALEQKNIKERFHKVELSNDLLKGLNPRVKFDNGQNRGFAVLLEGKTQVEKLWKNVRDCVLNKKCSLGINLKMPSTKKK